MMHTFDQAITATARQGFLSPLVVERIPGSPIYIQNFAELDMNMPPVESWRAFRFIDEFQRALPAPITRTVQTSNSLRGFNIYSLLLSDGTHLITYKFMAKDRMLLHFVQIYQLDKVIAQLRSPGQAITVFNKCYSVCPVPNEIPEHAESMKHVLLTLMITTFHFIYGVHEERTRYKEA